jgi:radical SAM protein with 4Fe4S-binding SPASM domain
MEEFVEAYKKALLYIIELNLAGTPLVEGYACILLSRILTPFCTGFVDLQSPTGAGINGVVYDFNGDVYPCDEARMLAKMGDRRFYLGSVNRDSYLDIFTSPVLQELIEVSCVETLPGCHSCPLQPYCGSDPCYYAIQGNLVGHRPSSDFCMKHKAIINSVGTHHGMTREFRMCSGRGSPTGRWPKSGVKRRARIKRHALGHNPPVYGGGQHQDLGLAQGQAGGFSGGFPG